MRNKIISSVLVYFIATLYSFGNATINTHGVDAYQFGDISPDEYIYKADGVDSLIFSSEEDVAFYKNISGDSPRIINLDTNKIQFFDIDLSQGQYNSTNILKLPASNINKHGNLIVYVRESAAVDFRYDFALDNIDQLTYPDIQRWLTDEDEAIWKFEFESYPGTTQWVLVKYTKHIDIPKQFSMFYFEDREPELVNIVRTLDRRWMIDNGLFDGDNGSWLVTITSANIGTNVTSLGDSVFSNCNDLTSVTIPDSVTDIGDVAFQDCSSLTNVTMSGKTTAQVSAMDYQSWGLSSNYVIVCTDGTLPPAETTFTFDDGTEQTYDIVGTLDRQWMTTNGLFENGSWIVTITSANIGTNVTSIGNNAFRDCSSLINVVIGNGVTSIGNYTFWHCGALTNVTIPDSMTSIGLFAFSSCNALYDTNTIPNVRLVDGWVVGWTDSLSGALDLTGICGIPGFAFAGCTNLTSVTIPDSVTSIGRDAFSGCSGLTNVTMTGKTTSQVQDMNYQDWSLSSGCVIHCTDDDITIP